MKTLKIDDIILKLQIWDTAGQEKHKNISTNYYKGAMGIILTYAINDI
jgi:GTPase SAR1 family protein